MNTLKRIDPRRPFTVTAEGLKRITLGATGGTVAMEFNAPGSAVAHHQQPKPRRTTAAPQRAFLVATHADRGALDDHARQTLAAAAFIADASTEVVLLVFGEFTGDAAALGADKLIELPMFDRRTFAPADELNALAACIAAYAPVHIFLPDNAHGDGDLGRRYAAAANASIATHVVEIDAAQLALEEADFIISAGNGVSDVPAFERLAGTLGAAMGASRVAVDDGKFTRDKQIGATGKTVEASVYIAFGISGAVQHLQGIKDCRHVIAVNLDGSAPIVKRANLTIIGDTQATIASLIDAVALARTSRSQASTPATVAVAEGVAA